MVNRTDISQLYGRDVYGRDGDKIGSVDDVYLEARTGEPEWLAVKTGLFGLKQSFVPLRGADISADRVQVPFAKEQVKDAPRIDPDGQLSHQEEDDLYRHYGFSSTGGVVDEGGRHARTETTERREGRGVKERIKDAVTDRDRGDDKDRDRDEYSEREQSQYTERDRGEYSERDRGDTGRATAGSDAMTRSEERLVAGAQTEEAGKARLRKYVVTEQEQVSVPVQREEVRLEREPITDANRDAALSGPAIQESEHEVTLRAERPVVDTEAVPVERVRLGKETVRDEERVEGEVRKERIDYDGPDDRRR
ncbi:PRC and DUF2382 domain-containing protein [Symbioplanes lichenis]|uniref:PRC and DUF2382 domain-containing protein n=1 Tax=Symbioplanes lichenis TaxID=1629072 RepID=UPI0027397DE8|nr:PRC and DUF2382 domain-containing protein [Actinoplanes lichenis]